MCTWRHCNRYAIQKMSRVSLIFCSFVEFFGTGLRFSVSTKYAYGFVALCFVVVISSTPSGFTWYIYSYLPFLLHWHWDTYDSLRWRHNGHDSVSNHQPPDCLLSRLFRRKSKKTSKRPSLAFVRWIHRGPVNSPHKWPVTRKMFPFDDVIMCPHASEVTLNCNSTMACSKVQHKIEREPAQYFLFAP